MFFNLLDIYAYKIIYVISPQPHHPYSYNLYLCMYQEVVKMNLERTRLGVIMGQKLISNHPCEISYIIHTFLKKLRMYTFHILSDNDSCSCQDGLNCLFPLQKLVHPSCVFWVWIDISTLHIKFSYLYAAPPILVMTPLLFTCAEMSSFTHTHFQLERYETFCFVHVYAF